jgi:hypothetical protein
MIYVNYTNTDKPELANVEYQLSLQEKGLLRVQDWNSTDTDTTFYYDRHDLALRLIEFKNFISDEQWEFFRTNENATIVVNFADDYLNQTDLDRFANDIKAKNVDNSRIYFVTMDPNFETFTKVGLAERGVHNVTVDHINILMKRVPPRYTQDTNTTKKFSIFSRNYRDWRLNLYAKLLNIGVLDNAIYSFHNYNPYTDEIYNFDEVRADLVKEGHEITPELNDWVNGMPYDLGNRGHKWSNAVYGALESSDFHIVIESHFDPYLGNNFDFARDTYSATNISPGFITEKVWKAITCKRPFIVAATPYILKDLRKLGYKTFDGLINESYDEIIDDKERLAAIVEEVDRINKLPIEEYKQLIESIKEITDFNHSLYIRQWESTSFVKYPLLHGIVVL